MRDRILKTLCVYFYVSYDPIPPAGRDKLWFTYAIKHKKPFGKHRRNIAEQANTQASIAQDVNSIKNKMHFIQCVIIAQSRKVRIPYFYCPAD